MQLFPNGYKGIGDSKHSGALGSVYRSVGIDANSEPGLIKVHQKLSKASSTTIDELCKVAIPVTDGSKLWFSSESGKIWRESSGTYTLVKTLSLAAGDLLTAYSEGKSFATNETLPKIKFSSDGYKLFVLDFESTTLAEYLMSEPFDVSTAYLPEINEDTAPAGSRSFFFGDSGSKLFILTKDYIYSYDTTPTWSFVGLSTTTFQFPLKAGGDPEDLWFSSDGTKVFVLNSDGDLDEYSLDTAWDLANDDLLVDYLVVGAGGASGGIGENTLQASGGGGGGEVKETLSANLLAGSYAVTVGTGGVAASNAIGGDGEDSVFNGVTADGGGGGGQGDGNGASAGTGGGGGSKVGGTTGGTGDDGGDGGDGVTDAGVHGGGGGGAGENGQDGSSANGAGDGGDGIQSSITGSATYYGGGGVGGAGGGSPDATAGQGGGGAEGVSGTDGLGGGGGGITGTSAGGQAGQDGGDGVVKIRYKTSVYNHTGGSSATDGDYTVVTFSADGTFVLSFDAHPSLVQTESLTEGTIRRAIAFSSDGSKMILIDFGQGSTYGAIYQYTLSTPWDITTISYDNQKVQFDKPLSGYFTDDYLFIANNTLVTQYTFGDGTEEVKTLDAKEFVNPTLATEISKVALDLLDEDSEIFVRLTDQTGVVNDAEKLAQSVKFSRDTIIDTVTVMMSENEGTPDNYSIKVSIQEDDGGDPSGTDLVAKTTVITENDLGTGSNIDDTFTFTFASSITLKLNKTYWVVFEVTDFGDLDGDEAPEFFANSSGVYANGSVKIYKSSSWTTTIDSNGPTSGWDLLMRLSYENTGADLGAESTDVAYVYWSTEHYLLRIPVSALSSWTDKVETVGRFSKGHDTFHPMLVQNQSLYIGDDTVMAEVDSEGVFTKETEFNVPIDETIRCLSDFDVDILVGTKRTNDGRVLRWDGVNESWSAQDTVFEKEGVTAFIRDDNYVYAAAGEFGRLYFYNGEKLEPYKRILGDWSPTARAVIHPNSVAFLLGVPAFGLSNVTGNPTLQGVYSLGSYSRDYPKILDLAFPISSGEFSGLSVGAIIVDGADLYVAWKGAAASGVDKLDYSAKYASAYFETLVLTPPKERGKLKTLEELSADYVSLPANTAVGFKYQKNYEGSFSSALTTVTDTNLSQVLARATIPNVAALQCRVDFTVSSNNAPEIENFDYNWANEDE